MYHNTNQEHGEELQRSIRKANAQENLILALFLKYPNRELSPFQVHENIDELRTAPLTSIRRGITNLTKCGMLKKTNNQVKGDYGKKCNTWKLTEDLR